MSNPVPSTYKADALPVELKRLFGFAETRTRVTGFKVLGPNHWTTKPKITVFDDENAANSLLIKSDLRLSGIEPELREWKSLILPLNYRRIGWRGDRTLAACANRS